VQINDDNRDWVHGMMRQMKGKDHNAPKFLNGGRVRERNGLFFLRNPNFVVKVGAFQRPGW